MNKKLAIILAILFGCLSSAPVTQAASCLPDESCMKPASGLSCVSRGACPGSSPSDPDYQECCKPGSGSAILPLPSNPGDCNGLSGNCGNYALNDFIKIGDNIATWILGIVGSLALLMFIYGGFVLLMSGGSSEKVAKGKSIIVGSVIGLVIVFTSFMIISFVLEQSGYYRGKGWFSTPK